MSDEQKLRGELFKLTMQKKWEEVEKIYKNPETHTIKLTKSEDTAFHVVISGYNSKCPDPRHKTCTERMISLMVEKETFREVLMTQNVRGDTPLHIAAAVGWEVICTLIAKKDENREFIKIRNKKNETPLFIAAHHGNLEAFSSLHGNYIDKERPDESLYRGKDGNTILHSAISGEYFRLAYFIIKHNKKLISSSNVEGETPLHVLARKPNVFYSSSNIGLCEFIIYKCVFVDDLKQPKHKPSVDTHGSTKAKFPKNYWTCVDIFFLLWDPIYKSHKGRVRSIRRKRAGSTDEESQPTPESCLDDSFSVSKKQNGVPTAGNVGNQIECEMEKSKNNDFFPPNYTTCISLFKFLTTVILTVLGIGFLKIRKIQEKKVRHSHAMEILNEMIDSGLSYIYENDGQRPDKEHKPFLEGGISLPESPPRDEEHEISPSAEAEIGRASATKDQPKGENDKKGQNQDCRKQIAKDKMPNGAVKETPFLVAAKMGILEMVKKILCAVPVAIQDLDSEGKNVVLLAAEYRQTTVFDYLMQENLPNYVFQHVDNEENSILHLAAKLGEKKPWRIPGAAFQMQWEIKWFKHVKSSIPPLSFSHHNAQDKTPRQIFTQTHEELKKSGNEWLVKTAESCSLVAALIATVAFATSATVPGGLNQDNGSPMLQGREGFDIFSIASLVALCLSVTALVFFLAIITSRFEERDFKIDLPRKLLIGLTCLFSSIAAMLLSFCAGHTFILREKLRIFAVPVYAATTIPVAIFVVAQLPLYFDLLLAACRKVPLRSYKVFHI